MSELRITSADRERAVAALGEHYAEGRLEKDEYDERSDAAWSAKTAGDLRPVFSDLPGGSPLDVPGPPWQRGAPYGQVPAGTGFSANRPSGTGVSGPFGPKSTRVRAVWHGLPTAVQVLLAIAVVAVVLSHLPLILVAGVVWFALARHGVVGKPRWARHQGGGCGTRR